MINKALETDLVHEILTSETRTNNPKPIKNGTHEYLRHTISWKRKMSRNVIVVITSKQYCASRPRSTSYHRCTVGFSRLTVSHGTLAPWRIIEKVVNRKKGKSVWFALKNWGTKNMGFASNSVFLTLFWRWGPESRELYRLWDYGMGYPILGYEIPRFLRVY